MDKKKKRYLTAAIAVVFWIAVWQVLSMAVGSGILLPGPADTVAAIVRLAGTASFWSAVGTSFARIVSGFAAAVVAGSVMALLSCVFMPVKVIVSPIVRLVKAVPVASFIILVNIWIASEGLPFIISFLMVFPVIYTNVSAGIESTDVRLLETATVFRMRFSGKLKYIYLPQVMPHFVSACSVGLGFCWKSGIAAEIIALVPGSIGRNLYDSKLYLLTDELFAWTVVIVILSVGFEKLVTMLLRKLSGVK